MNQQVSNCGNQSQSKADPAPEFGIAGAFLRACEIAMGKFGFYLGCIDDRGYAKRQTTAQRDQNGLSQVVRDMRWGFELDG